LIYEIDFGVKIQSKLRIDLIMNQLYSKCFEEFLN
jgi:hypothetical protein